MNTKRDALETVEEFYRLLTEHDIPDGCQIPDLPPKMTGKQAASIIWYLQEIPRCLPDHIEHCESCDRLGDSWSENFEYVESKKMRLCESCYGAEKAFKCCKCENHDCHEAPGRLAVLTEPEGEMERGLYQITSWPFYADGMVTGFLFESAFQRLGEVPDDVDTEGYPMGFLCNHCEALCHPSQRAAEPTQAAT
jgi:hypothetical protein